MAEAGRSLAIDVSELKVVITGGASGIGFGLAKAFAAGGAQVHIADANPAAAAEAVAAIAGLTATVADVAAPDGADRTLAEAQTRFGGLDVLVNNVGVAGPTGGIETYADADIERTLDVNLKSHFYFAGRSISLLRASRRNPAILAMSSVAGRLGYGLRTPYVATKWAIVGLVKSLAIELGPQGVRANAILPGIVEGPRMDKVIADRARAEGVSFEAMRGAYLSKVSLRRMVQAEDVAHLALFLCSPLARNITGQAISVDGHVEYL